jgi:hypothetical protein
MFRAAWRRADFAVCERVLDRFPEAVPADETARLGERARFLDDGRLEYRLPHAERVEIVEARRSSSRALPDVRTLERTAPGIFVGEAPSADGRLLLTLSSGRVTWDEVRHG